LGKPGFQHATTTFLASNLYAGQLLKPLHWFLHRKTPIQDGIVVKRWKQSQAGRFITRWSRSYSVFFLCDPRR